MKSWYKSKTVWANIVALVVYTLEQQFGPEIIGPDAALVVLAAINLLLRVVTREPIKF